MKREEVIVVNSVPEKVIEEVFSLGTKRQAWWSSGHTKLGNGAYGDVYDVMGFAVKIYSCWDDEEDINCDDGTVLSRLQGCDLFPKLYAYVPHKFMIMEKIEGKTFQKIQDGDLMDSDWKTAIDNGYKFIQSKGLVFADVHNENVMLTTEGKVKIVDVGKMSGKGTIDSLDWIVGFFQEYYDRTTETKRLQLRNQIFEAQVKSVENMLIAI